MLTYALPYGDFTVSMTDGLNEARALRVAEIMNDFRTLQLHISQLKTDPPPGEETAEGYVLMRQFILEAQSVLMHQFRPDMTQPGHGNGDREKVQLQRIIVDASVRRFQAHRIYLKVAAVRRWIMNRTQLLQGQKPNGQHRAQLRALDDTLRNELSSITDSVVVNNLRNADMRAGHWLNEDPSLSTILNWLRAQS